MFSFACNGKLFAATMHTNHDTITAIATPIGIGAILVIRISGDRAIAAVDNIFHGRKRLSTVGSHTVHYGNICNPDGQVIDDVLVTVFRAPQSYTGEDSCEIGTHGNPFIGRKIIELLLADNVRLAQPGEFTRRAFLNGRLDLAQAEAVVDVIEASTDASLRGARNQLDGILSGKVSSLRSMLVDISSLVELELDFSEEDLEFIGRQELVGRIDVFLAELKALLQTYSFGKIIKDGVQLAIVGKPNVGKSSLLNYLLKEARAIVSNIPGTTRDVIREEMVIHGILFRIHDTAGIRPTVDEIEEQGVLRSRQTVKDADLVVFLNDVESGFDEEMYRELLALTDKCRVIVALNKIDLSDDPTLKADVKISALTGQGIDRLLAILENKALGTKTYSENAAIVSNVRHYHSLNKCYQALLEVKNSARQQLSGEFIAVDLRDAQLALDEIIGSITSEDVLANIFSRFCIGK